MWEGFLFEVFLLSCSYLAATLIIVPLATIWHRQKPVHLMAIAVAVAAVGAGAGAVDRAVHSGGGTSTTRSIDGCGNIQSPPELPPPFVPVADGEALDVRLNWTVAAGTYAVERTLINPSMLWDVGGQMMRAARAHAVTCNATYGDALYDGINNATEFVTTWQIGRAHV